MFSQEKFGTPARAPDGEFPLRKHSVLLRQVASILLEVSEDGYDEGKETANYQ